MTENTCVPADPTVGGWHWLEHDNSLRSSVSVYWRIEDYADAPAEGFWELEEDYDGYEASLRGYRYHSPCPTPAEMAERNREIAELRGAMAELRGAMAELRECAELRGDNDLPHPSDDPKMWTARMQDAWGAAMALVEGDEFRASVAGSRKHES